MDLGTHEFLIQWDNICLSASGHAKMMTYFSFQAEHFA